MELLAYVVYDNKAECFFRPMFLQTDGVAIRALVDEVASGKGPLAAHPGDYVVFCVGAFDDQIGELQPFRPRSLGLVSQIVHQHTKAFQDKQGGLSDAVSDEPPVLDGSDGGNSEVDV